jgi:hypothetical protein
MINLWKNPLSADKLLNFRFYGSESLWEEYSNTETYETKDSLYNCHSADADGVSPLQPTESHVRSVA